MTQNNRIGFSSRIGFIMAAAGSAVGLGNIWGFPTQTANNGGAAFVLVYLILAICLAFPAFMAELLIGRYAQANPVTALQKISKHVWQKRAAVIVGVGGVLCASLVLSFYGIIAGWMMSFALEPALVLFSLPEAAQWVVTQSFLRNVLFTAVFMILTVLIIRKGVQRGIEQWSKRLMPALILLLIALIGYVLTLDGAMTGVNAYLNPDLSRVLQPDLLISALGHAFFSLSLGSGVMIIYGSYISKNENIVSLGVQVAMLDIAIAFLAGLLIIPAMYVAQAQGVTIFTESGSLVSGSGVVFTVLPAFFDAMGSAGIWVSLAFFILMSIAALTSSISMLEAPVALIVERYRLSRTRATLCIGLLIFIVSVVIIAQLDVLFDLVVTIATVYGQPIIAMCCCIYVGWIWHRNELLTEIKHGYEAVEDSLFWKIWPWYVKVVCPSAIVLVFWHSFL